MCCRGFDIYEKRGEDILGEYIGSLIAISAVAALGSYAAYNPSDKVTRAAISLIVLYTVSVYAVGVSEWVGELDFESLSGDGAEIAISDSEYARVAEESFKLGIKRAVCDKFGISEEKMSVSVYGFNLENMKAERINIVLFDAVSADYRAIEVYVEGCGLGKCQAEVRLG